MQSSLGFFSALFTPPHCMYSLCLLALQIVKAVRILIEFDSRSFGRLVTKIQRFNMSIRMRLVGFHTAVLPTFMLRHEIMT